MIRRTLLLTAFALIAVPFAANAATANDSKTYTGRSAEDVFDAAREAIVANGWKIKDESKKDGLIQARTKVSAMSWGASVNVTVNETKKGVKVTASASTEMSTSKKTNADLERFFAKLDKKLDDE